MKTIGLIGGMSWESTATYYQIINERVSAALGGLHSARCLMYSFDFAAIEKFQSRDDWATCAQMVTKAAQILEAAGADFIVICTNTMHKVVPTLRAQIHIPILHIAEVTAQALKDAGISTVGLLGTRVTMEGEFYKDVIEASGIRVLVPDADARAVVDGIIFHELCLGRIEDASRQKLLAMAEGLSARGAEGIILGCTEIGLLLSQKKTTLPLFDTALLHAEAAARVAMEEG
ncbi:MAG: aspartate/glutamate racemase family protein [Peptococcaceae bacterium]|nr:aspartate/glutamate racemase family protein [Peptococcaceae bacterium]